MNLHNLKFKVNEKTGTLQGLLKFKFKISLVQGEKKQSTYNENSPGEDMMDMQQLKSPDNIFRGCQNIYNYAALRTHLLPGIIFVGRKEKYP